jgi:transcriptional regulator with XRE-family HTH domain
MGMRRGTFRRGGDMTQPSSPTVWRRWMTFEMRRLRQEAGLSQAEVAKVLGCQVAKISLMESGQRNVQEDDLHTLLDLYEVPEDRRPSYVDAAKTMRKKGWWQRYGQPTLQQWLEPYVGFEQEAERLRTYQPVIIHGLLQTPEYAAACMRRITTALSPERINRRVELRKQRQQSVLWREGNPLRLWAVLDEAALRRIVGSREIMRDQLTHLADLASKHAHITVQIIPFARGAYDANYGAFYILSFPWPTDPGIVYIEHRSGALYLDSLKEVDDHSQVFEQLCALALSPDESIEMVRNVAEDYGTKDD